MRLVEILNQLTEIESLLIESKGELTPEDDTKLKLFTESMLEKVDGYRHFFDRLSLSVEYWKEKEDEAKKIRKALEGNLDHAKNYLKSVMLERGISTLEGEEFSFKISPTKGTIKIIDEQSCKDVYGKEKITIEIDKEKIREDLEKGINLGFAVLEQTYSLRSSAKTKQIKKEK